jgi:hypothetical protein
MSQLTPLSEVDSFDIWLGMGKARHLRMPLTDKFQQALKGSMMEATGVYRERHASLTRKTLIANLHSSGLPATTQSRLVDRNDSIGLIGEIITEHLSTARKHEILWAKWKVGGTSKSPGIDLLTKIHRGSQSNLRLIESKHIHDEIKGKAPSQCTSSIKGRLIDGLEEFDQDKTRLNLAGILMKMSKIIRYLKAANSSATIIEQSHDFVNSSLLQDEYSSEVVTSVDSKYCTNSTLSPSVKDLQLPSSVGKHTMNLTILACDSLEATTDEIC